jgi:hypothetical protein
VSRPCNLIPCLLVSTCVGGSTEIFPHLFFYLLINSLATSYYFLGGKSFNAMETISSFSLLDCPFTIRRPIQFESRFTILYVIMRIYSMGLRGAYFNPIFQ